MQVTEVNRQITCSGEMVTEYMAGKLAVRLTGTFGDRATLDDLLYAIASQRIAERFWQKRDNIVRNGGFDIIRVGKG
jgi:hypothetical protein